MASLESLTRASGGSVIGLCLHPFPPGLCSARMQHGRRALGVSKRGLTARGWREGQPLPTQACDRLYSWSSASCPLARRRDGLGRPTLPSSPAVLVPKRDGKGNQAT